MDAARREVKAWRLEKLTHVRADVEMDPHTAFFVLAWDAFKAAAFPYDEGLRLARAVGVDLEREIIGRIAEKKADNMVLWDSSRRAAKGVLGAPDGSRAILDALHHAAHIARTRHVGAAKDFITETRIGENPAFLIGLEAVLNVLPPAKFYSGIDLKGDVEAAGNDFDALEKLRQLAFHDRVERPKQLDLFNLPVNASQPA